MAANDHSFLTSNSIRQFYNDRSIFVTGATGFMGKVLLEKLLRSCPTIKAIYVLMRPNQKQDVRCRLDQLLTSKIFDRLRKDDPNSLTKLYPVSGELTLPNLGISPVDLHRITTDVSVVFHSAATLKFDEALKCAVQINVFGTRTLIEICRKMPQLVAMVHVSTAYCNCNRNMIDEVVYPMSVRPQNIIDSMAWMDAEAISALTPVLLKDRPNTYTFTKALAENLLLEECGDIPAAIVRPSIVAASWREPFPGWIDNLNGATGIILGCGKGLIQSVRCKGDLAADIVPVDITVNTMIVTAWYTATYRPNNVQVYHCTSGGINKLLWGELDGHVNRLSRTLPLNGVFWYPSYSFNISKTYHSWCLFLYQMVPAYICDALSWMGGKRPRLVKMQRNIHKALQVLEYFTTHEWSFSNENFLRLVHCVPPAERHIFCIDMRDMDWKSYLDDYFLGIKQYVLKEDLASLPLARKHLRNMLLLRYLAHFLGFVLLWRILIAHSSFARHFWYQIIRITALISRSLPTHWKNI